MSQSEEDSCNMGYWVLSGCNLMKALRRVQDGEDPDLVYAELYANSDVTRYSGGGDAGTR